MSEVNPVFNEAIKSLQKKTWEDDLMRMVDRTATVHVEGIELDVEYEHCDGNDDASVLSVFVKDVDIYDLLSEDMLEDILMLSIRSNK